MKKIENVNKPTIKKNNEKSELKRRYTISVVPKSNGFQARVTLKVIGGVKNPRISAYSKTVKGSVCKILDKMSEQLKEYKSMNLLKEEICISIYDSVLISIRDLKISTDKTVMGSAIKLFKILTVEKNIPNDESNFQNNNFSNVTSLPLLNNHLKFNPRENEMENNLNCIQQNQYRPVCTKNFEMVALEWFEYKLSLTKKSNDNPKPLSEKTVCGYSKILKLEIIPYFKNNQNINFIKEKDLKNCIDSIKSFRSKELCYIVLKMIFDYAREKNYIFIIPKLKRPQKPYTDKEENLIFIESDRQDIWLECFEEEDTDVALLFETMLLTGLRPEEACGLKWCSLDFNINELTVNNAYKDVPIYDGIKIVGHVRKDDRLKTPESYRKIPLNPRLKRRLLEHKNKQKLLFKKCGLKWNENGYVFLNTHKKPFVPETLPKLMRQFREKYNLEYMTAYGLRHSFATFCSEQGMEEIVLMRLMGHSNFDTTQKYYICISSKRKRQAIESVYKNIFEKESRNKKLVKK